MAAAAGRKQDPGPRAVAVSRDPQVTFRFVSLTEVTPKLSEIGWGWRLKMTFEFLTSAKCHFSVGRAWMKKEKKGKNSYIPHGDAWALGGAAEVLSQSQWLRILILSATNQTL